jgi:drug/metabolite transporter (DMT)-like permease
MIIGRSLSGAFYFATFLYLSATSTITLYKLNPIYTFILLLFLIKLPLSLSSFTNVLIGVVVAISGSILSVYNFNGASSMSIEAVIPGIVFVVLAGFFWSVYMVSSESHKGSQISKACMWQRQRYVANIYLISSIPFVLLVILLTFLRPDITDIRAITFSEIILISPLGLLSGVIGILYFEALKRISSLLISVIISLEIFFTMIFEAVFIGHDLGWNVFLGGLLVAVGAVSVGREAGKLKLNAS